MRKINKDKLMEIAEQPTAEMIAHNRKRRERSEIMAEVGKLALKIRMELRHQNKTQKDLASMLGASPSAVSNYLSGEANLESFTLLAIQKALNIQLINTDMVDHNAPHEAEPNGYDSDEDDKTNLPYPYSYSIKVAAPQYVMDGDCQYSKVKFG